MLKHSVNQHTLQFHRPGGTSRGVLTKKESWFISIWHSEAPSIVGVGECSIIRGLSPDMFEEIDTVLANLSWTDIGLSAISIATIQSFPAIRFAVETALLDLQNGGRRILFDTDFARGNSGMKINGLIWMGSEAFMKAQIRQKLNDGFRCVKLKIGALDFQTEIDVIAQIRKTYSADDVEIRVDANGAFDISDAPEKLRRLSELDMHSIEQPIKAGNWKAMAALCASSPLAIALDEELIGIDSYEEQESLLSEIKPQYIILKPSLLGGIRASEKWIELADKKGIGWWVTSALESNVGLNAIAQWTASLNSDMYQGLGTGQLFTNNIASPLYLEKDIIKYNPKSKWGSIPK